MKKKRTRINFAVLWRWGHTGCMWKIFKETGSQLAHSFALTCTLEGYHHHYYDCKIKPTDHDYMAIFIYNGVSKKNLAVRYKMIIINANSGIQTQYPGGSTGCRKNFLDHITS